MPTKIIVVTAADIRLGEQGECRRCPVARALGRAINRKVKVFPRVFHYQQPRTYRWISDISLPEKVRHFIDAFDDGRLVRPFRFTINMPR